MFRISFLSRTFIKPILGITALLLSVPASQAAIILRIDSVAKTFQWVGSYSTDTYSLGKGESQRITLGTSSYVGGHSTSIGSLDVTLTGSSWIDLAGSEPGQLQLASSSLRSYLGNARNGDDESSHSFSLNIEADETLYSYASSYNAELEGYLLSFDQAELYLWIGAEAGPLVGSVEVIPEPSLSLLLLPGLGLLWMARSKSKAKV